MVDNVAVTAGSGTDIATDDIGNVHHQKVKIEWGPNNTVNETDAASGKALSVQGEAAENAATTGNPVLTGGRYDASARTLGDGDVGAVALGTDGHVLVREENTISTNNSTTSAFTTGENRVFTGDDVSQYASVTVYIDNSHDSATDGLKFQFSNDNTNFDSSVSFTYTEADGARIFQLPVVARYFRINYTNSANNNTHTRIQTILHVHPVSTTIHRLVDDIDPDRSAEVVKSVIFAQAAGTGDFVPVDSTAAGNLKVAIEEGESLAFDGETATGKEGWVMLGSDSSNLYHLSVNATGEINLAAQGNDSTALGPGIVMQGDDGTDRKNINVDPTTGDVQVDVTNTVTVDLAGNNDVTVTGGNAHDGTTLGNPVLGGARATNSVEGVTQVANGDLTHIQADLNGVTITRPHTTLEEIIVEDNSATTTASTALTNFGVGGANIHNYITTISVANTSATDVYVELEDGSGGTTFFIIMAPAGGGATISFPVPLKQPTANTGLFTALSGAASTVYVSTVGFQANG
jgi:hypothetical protein